MEELGRVGLGGQVSGVGGRRLHAEARSPVALGEADQVLGEVQKHEEADVAARASNAAAPYRTMFPWKYECSPPRIVLANGLI